MLLLVSASAFAKELPAKIQAAFEKMYPQAVNVEWEQMAGCYVAEFVMDNREIDVWFDENAQWVMTENDVESLEKVPAPVSEAFMESIMSSMSENNHFPQTSYNNCYRSGSLQFQ